MEPTINTNEKATMAEETASEPIIVQLGSGLHDWIGQGRDPRYPVEQYNVFL